MLNKNFKHKEYSKNRNSLRYLIAKPYKEQPSYTIHKFLESNKVFIKNKKETCEGHKVNIYYEIIIKNKSLFLNIYISKDHLITLKIISENSEINLKTRVLDEVICTLKSRIDSIIQ